MTLQEKIEAVDALRKIEILFKYYEDPIYLKALKYSREALQKEIVVTKAVNDVFVLPKCYKIKGSKEDIEKLKEAIKKDDNAFGTFINELVTEKLKEQNTNYGIIFQKGDNKDE